MQQQLDALRLADHLLVACVFDGVLAPYAPRPDRARASMTVLESLRLAARFANTSVVILSGRSMCDLKRKLRDTSDLWLVGCHGASISGPGFRLPPFEVSKEELNVVARLMQRCAPQRRGFYLERKPTGIAVHYREAPAAEAARVLPMLTYGIALPAGLQVRYGRKVVEFLAGRADEGRALAMIKDSVQARRIVLFGDSVADADAFESLGPDDLAFRIESESVEMHSLSATIEVAQEVIVNFLSRRRLALSGLAEGAIALEE